MVDLSAALLRIACLDDYSTGYCLHTIWLIIANMHMVCCLGLLVLMGSLEFM